jgi:predicted enzyme related to lactoylglutathione lyase
MPNPVVHFEAIGKDGAKLRDFYSTVFGWQFNVMPEMDYGLVDNGGAGINGGIGTGDAPHSMFYIEVADPQATLDKIGQSGGKTVSPVMEIPGVVTLASFSDTEGNVVGLVKAGDDGPPGSDQPKANPVTWFEIVGKDSSKLRGFYSAVFGWQYQIPPDMDYGMVDNEGRGIGGGVGGGDAAHAIFYAEVDDPQSFMSKVEASGGKVATPVMDGGMVTFGHFTDPEGNLVGLFKSNQ